MAKVLITNGLEQQYITQIAKKGHEIIDKRVNENELKELIKEVNCIVVGYDTKITREVIDEALKTKNLRVIVRAGAILDNVDVDYAKKKGIRTYSTPSGTTNAVAEMVIGQMITISRNIHLTNINMRKGEWDREKYYGTEISRKTLGLVGFGRIARAIAEKAKSLSMRVIYYDKYSTTELYGYEPVTMDELLTQSDYISLHIPGGEENHHIIDEGTFKLMKDGVFFINYSNRGVVDDEALLDAIDSGKVKAAALDVFDDEPVKNERILNNPKISLTPHIGSLTAEADLRIAKETVRFVVENL
ncbi:NAD(P)-dependent oxidoreductase [Miniphocaeibacter massiliensis]|uniref:NAD(P)-dependent oxidoreductase n=1 Tax=Miniphocaeibacter massiliensis TaxID=2041841 RepID=UPI000C1BF0C1|nr:NAD(P)-dependent oxidoreductase [Miniphocaeibacter massiliensis]